MATCNTNLVQNIGFGDDATHTQRTVDIEPVGSVTLPTKPVEVLADDEADAWTRIHHFQVTLPGLAHQAFNFTTRKLRRTT